MPLWWSNADLAESGIKQLQLDIDFARGLKAGQWIVWGNGHEKRFGRILSKINDCFVVKNSCNDTGSVTLKELILGEVAPIDGDHV